MTTGGTNQRVTVYCLTSEEWFPSYKLDTSSGLSNGIYTPLLVEVTLYSRYREYPWRILVKGADDYMMVFDTHDETKARNTYLEVITMPDVTKNALKKIGFEVF